MNELNGAAALVRLLQWHGVRHVFGLCGDTSLPLYDALHRLDHGMTHVLTRDERCAGYMADVYARLSNRIGVCEGPSGGGATYLAPALIEANDSSVAMLAITSDVAVASRGRYPLTELDQQALFRPLTKWNAVVNASPQLPHLVRRAFAAATGGRPGAVHLGLPIDVQRGPVDEASVWADPGLDRWPSRRVAPDPAEVERAARLLSQCVRPVLLCGGGPVSAGACEEVAKLAEKLGAPVLTSVSGKGAIADSHPLAGGVVGSNGGVVETREIVDAADCVLLVGCRAGSVTTEKWRHPKPGACKIIHIDIDPEAIGVSYRADAALVGDAKLTLAALIAAIGEATADRVDDARTLVQAAREKKFARFAKLAASEEKPIRPERLVATLNRILPEDATIVADPGTPCPYFSAYYRLAQAGRYFISNRAHGALGYSLPGAIGAQFARPAKKCVAVMGDGSFGFSVGELETAMRYRLPILFVVVANSGYGWIKAGQAASFGRRFYSVDFGAGEHARIAEGFGLKAWRVEEPAALEGALRQAAACEGPALVEAICQPLHEAAAPVSEWIA